MALIKVNQAFRYALLGILVVEFIKGVHDVDDEIARCAIDDLKVAEPTKDATNVLPPITHDINGNILPGVVIDEEAEAQAKAEAEAQAKAEAEAQAKAEAEAQAKAEAEAQAKAEAEAQANNKKAAK
jgi:hypothetical protein